MARIYWKSFIDKIISLSTSFLSSLMVPVELFFRDSRAATSKSDYKRTLC